MPIARVIRRGWTTLLSSRLVSGRRAAPLSELVMERSIVPDDAGEQRGACAR